MENIIERNKTLNFYSYSDSLQRVRPSNPYRMRGSLNLGYVSEQDYQDLKNILEHAINFLNEPKETAPHEFKIAVVGQHTIFTSSSAALEILEKMVAASEKSLTQAGLQPAQAGEFTQGARKFLSSGDKVTAAAAPVQKLQAAQ